MMLRRCSLAWLLCAVSGVSSAQGDAASAPKQPDKEVAEKLAALKDVVEDRKCARDGEAPDLITVLVQKWQAGLADKDKKDVIKGLGNVFATGKLREPEKAQIYIATAAALGQLGPDGAKPLQDAFEGKKIPDKEAWVPVREGMLKAIGRTKDESRVKFLLDVARRDSEAPLQAAAGEALGNFDESKQDLRKEVVNGLLIKWGEMDSRARVIDPADIEAQNQRKRLAVISGKWNDTLRRLTKQQFDNFPEWQEWMNKNKGKDWK
jgi:hypothetical protein